MAMSLCFAFLIFGTIANNIAAADDKVYLKHVSKNFECYQEKSCVFGNLTFFKNETDLCFKACLNVDECSALVMRPYSENSIECFFLTNTTNSTTFAGQTNQTLEKSGVHTFVKTAKKCEFWCHNHTFDGNSSIEDLDTNTNNLISKVVYGQKSSWNMRCALEDHECSACTECEEIEKQCEPWCQYAEVSWMTKCTWDFMSCSSCGECNHLHYYTDTPDCGTNDLLFCSTINSVDLIKNCSLTDDHTGTLLTQLVKFYCPHLCKQCSTTTTSSTMSSTSSSTSTSSSSSTSSSTSSLTSSSTSTSTSSSTFSSTSASTSPSIFSSTPMTWVPETKGQTISTSTKTATVSQAKPAVKKTTLSPENKNKNKNDEMTNNFLKWILIGICSALFFLFFFGTPIFYLIHKFHQQQLEQASEMQFSNPINNEGRNFTNPLYSTLPETLSETFTEQPVKQENKSDEYIDVEDAASKNDATNNASV